MSGSGGVSSSSPGEAAGEPQRQRRQPQRSKVLDGQLALRTFGARWELGAAAAALLAEKSHSHTICFSASETQLGVCCCLGGNAIARGALLRQAPEEVQGRRTAAAVFLKMCYLIPLQ